MSKYKFVEHEPIGKTRDRTIINGEIVEFELDKWFRHRHGICIQGMRKEKGIGLRKAAKRLGMTAKELSWLEKGRLSFYDGRDFHLAFDSLHWGMDM